MLIASEQPPFDDKNYLYELKFDGVRCLLYVYKNSIELINKRGLLLNAKFPELTNIYKQIKQPCILDGELYIFANKRPDFFQIQKRTLMSDPFKIRLHSKQYPASYTAFDILYTQTTCVMQEPLHKRKKILNKLISESDRCSVARYIEEQGIAFFDLTKKKGLEGIVAKQKESKYYPGKRTKDWIKCKNLIDEDFLILGYIIKEQGILSLILAQYSLNKQLLYKGHVSMGTSLSYLQTHSSITSDCPFIPIPKGNEDAIWIRPFLVGTVKFMEYTTNGGLRQPVFKGFRDDKEPETCIEKAHH